MTTSATPSIRWRRIAMLLAMLVVAALAVSGSVIATRAMAVATLPPDTPTALRSSTTYTSVSVHWPTVTGASDYRFVLASDPAMTQVLRRTTTRATHITTRHLAQGHQYYYRVTPVNAWGVRGYSTAVASDRTKVVPLDAPEDVAITAATSTSLRVGWSTVADADSYTVRLFDTERGGKPVKTVGPVTETRAEISGIPVSTIGRDYYVEVRANRADGVHADSIRVRADTVPATPQGLHTVAHSPLGVTVAWQAAAGAQSYRVERADDAAFDHVVKTYTVPYAYTRLALNDLKGGQKAYLRVRAINGTKAGHASGVMHVTVPKTTKTMNLRVATFNVLNLRHDKTVAPWYARRQSVATIINSAHPDVLGLQEASQSAKSGVDGKTQVDDIASMTSPHLTRSLAASARGTQLLYNAKKLKALKAGVITLPLFPDDTPRLAGWIVLQDKHTKTKFVAVNTHLTNGPGDAQDAVRQKQAKAILSKLAKVNPKNLPVVFTGDLNSFDQRTPVTPMSILARHGYLDTDHSAATTTNDDLNSLNGYYDDAYNTVQGVKLDHVIASQTVGVRHYEVVPGATDPSGTPTANASDHRLIFSDLVFTAPHKKKSKKK